MHTHIYDIHASAYIYINICMHNTHTYGIYIYTNMHIHCNHMQAYAYTYTHTHTYTSSRSSRIPKLNEVKWKLISTRWHRRSAKHPESLALTSNHAALLPLRSSGGCPLSAPQGPFDVAGDGSAGVTPRFRTSQQQQGVGGGRGCRRLHRREREELGWDVLGEEEGGRERRKKGSAQSCNPIAAPRRCDAGEVDGAETYSGIKQPEDANKCGEACAHAHRSGCKWVTPQRVSTDVLIWDERAKTQVSHLH